MTPPFLKIATGLSLAALLAAAGCGGGTVSTSVSFAPATRTLQVTPSLGKFSAGTQVLLKRTNGAEIANGTLDAQGSVSLRVGSYTGPILVEVVGGTSAQYFDEGAAAWLPFGEGSVLRAVAHTPPTQMGVTALTHAAVARMEAQGPLSNASTTAIRSANNKVAAVFGLSDVLAAPTAVGSTSDPKLNIAKVADKYALLLAALAKTAVHPRTAYAVAQGMAADLKDDVLDRKDATNTNYANITIESAPDADMIRTQYSAAAELFADASSRDLIRQEPIAIRTTVSDVEIQSNQSDIDLAKAMFAELRSVLRGYSNGSDGFLDTQGRRLSRDAAFMGQPLLDKAVGALTTMSLGLSTYREARDYENKGRTTATHPWRLEQDGDTPVLVRQEGNLRTLVQQKTPYSRCWTPYNRSTGAGPVECLLAESSAYSAGSVRLVHLTLTPTGGVGDAFSYSARRVTVPVNGADSDAPTLGADPRSASTEGPVGSGRFTQSYVGSQVTKITADGTLPPSGDTSALDSIQLSAGRYSVAANTYRHALTGTATLTGFQTGSEPPPSATVRYVLDTGSFIDTVDSAAGTRIHAATLIGSAETLETRVNGSLQLANFATDADGVGHRATTVGVTGLLSDISGNGAGPFLSGTYSARISNYSSHRSRAPESPSNPLLSNYSFKGTLQAPQKAGLQLTVSSTKTGFQTEDAVVDYNYGGRRFTGSIKNSGTQTTLLLSNQDGIQISKTTGPGERYAVTRSGADLASIANGKIDYRDGSSESLQ